MKTKNRVVILVLLTVLVLVEGAEDEAGHRNNNKDQDSSSTTADHRPWTLSNFPRLEKVCRTPLSRHGCDPDVVFSDRDWQAIDQALATPSRMQVSCDRSGDESAATVQFGVAITRKVSELSQDSLSIFMLCIVCVYKYYVNVVHVSTHLGRFFDTSSMMVYNS